RSFANEKKNTENSIINDQNNEVLKQALNLQLMADSLNRLAKSKRSELKQIDNIEEKNNLKTEISILEKQSRKIQQDADKKYMLAETSNKDDTLPEPSIIELKEIINGIKVYQYKEVLNVQYDEENKNILKNEPEKRPDNSQVQSNKEEFFINDKPVYSNPIPIRDMLSDDLMYLIQLGVYSKQLPDSAFGGLSSPEFDT
ncbi:MAG: hypothetical protein JXK07_06380, partial [Spirochaetes bacterium]|nr:hypothetical protein [Spirochaetota bacterium]